MATRTQPQRPKASKSQPDDRQRSYRNVQFVRASSPVPGDMMGSVPIRGEAQSKTGGFAKYVPGPIKRLVRGVGNMLGKSYERVSSWTLRNLHLSSWYLGLSGGKWSDATYSTLSAKAFNNPYAFRSLFLLSQLTSSLKVKAVNNEEKSEDADSAFLDALKRPNPECGYQTFVIWIIYHLYFGGEFFLYFPGTPLTGSNAGKPGEKGIHLIRPDRITRINWDADGVTPKSYYWQPINGRLKKTTIPAIRILHIKWPNPFNPDRGLPLMISVLRALDLMEAGDDWNKAVADGKGRVPGYISWTPPKPGMTMDDDQWDDFKRRSNEQWDKAAESSRPFYLGGEFQFQEAGQSQKDTDWLGGAELYARQIALGLGFDPALIGDASNKTYSNLETALRAAFLLTVLPLWGWVLDELNTRMMPRYGDEAMLTVDESQISALEEDTNAKHQRMREDMKAGVMSIDEVRAEIAGLDARGGMADEITVLFNRVLLESIRDAQPMSLSDAGGTLAKLPPKLFERMLMAMLTDENITLSGEPSGEPSSDGHPTGVPVIDDRGE